MRIVPLALTALVLSNAAWARDSGQVLGSYSPAFTLSAPSPLNARTNLNRVSLTWSNIKGETGFVVERRKGTNPFAQIGKVTTDATTYTDVLTTSGIYQYRVRAYSASRLSTTYSPYTNTAYINTPTLTTGSTTTGSTATTT